MRGCLRSGHISCCTPVGANLLAVVSRCVSRQVAESETGQEKTEEATPKRLEKSKEEGQVAPLKRAQHNRHSDCGHCRVLIMFGAQIGASLLQVMERSFSMPREAAFDTNIALEFLFSGFAVGFESLIPLFVLVAAAAMPRPGGLGWVANVEQGDDAQVFADESA